jgi:Arm domain-containing DNA-binding protein
MRQKISKSAINRLKPGQSIADSNPVGLVARRLPSGVVTYGYRYRHKETGRQHWVGLGTDLAPEQARARALKVAGQARNGEKPPSSAEVTAKWRKTLARTVNDVLDDFIERYARPNSRSVDQIERAFAIDVRPKIGEKAITELRRLDIVELLDGIEDRGSVLSYLADPIAPLQVAALDKAAPSLGVTIFVRDIRSETDLTPAFDAGARERVDGLLTTAESVLFVSPSSDQGARYTPQTSRHLSLCTSSHRWRPDGL